MDFPLERFERPAAPLLLLLQPATHRGDASAPTGVQRRIEKVAQRSSGSAAMQFERAGTPARVPARFLCLLLATLAVGCASPVTGFVTGLQVYGDSTVKAGTAAFEGAIVSGVGEFNGEVTWTIVNGIGTLQKDQQPNPNPTTFYAVPITAPIGEVDTLSAISVGNPYVTQQFYVRVVSN
jgi:hypothetical protein